MKATKQSKAPFVVVLPLVVLGACTKEPIIYSNPPPDPDAYPVLEPPPESYSQRTTQEDGACFVEVAVNPPFRVEVSCKAPIEPAAEGEKWCKVATAKDPGAKVGVSCDSK